jgi:outer membrane protein assembly factor BamB
MLIARWLAVLLLTSALVRADDASGTPSLPFWDKSAGGRDVQDWPMLGGRPDRNPVADEKGLPSHFDAVKSKNVKWMADLGTMTYGTPVVAGGRVFVGTNNEHPRDPAIKGDRGVLMCFAERDGRFLWQAVHEKLETREAEDFPHIGLASTPCVVGDQVFYISNRAELVCRSVSDGKALWTLDLRKELGVRPHQGSASSPLVVGDRVFALTGHGSDYKKHKVLNPQAPSFIAVDRVSGKVLWQDNSPGANILAGQWGSPSYGTVDGREQVIFPGGDGWVYSFTPATGKLIWKFNCKAHEKLDADGKPETANQLLAAPVLSGHRVVIATGIDTDTNGPGCLRAIDARQRGDVTSTAELWRIAGDDFGATMSTVAIHEGLVYAVQLAGFVDCIELETGKRIWQHDLLSTSWGTPLVADGKLYVRDGDDEVLVFKTGREKKLLAKNDSMPSLGNGSIVAANGVLYLAGSKKLYAVAELK